MARQIAASLSSLQLVKARCSLSPSPSTALASELQTISISSRRGEQQHLRPTATSARASSDELPAKQQQTSNNEPARSSHLHSSHLRRNSSSKMDLTRSVIATEEAQYLKELIQDYIASFIKVGDKNDFHQYVAENLDSLVQLTLELSTQIWKEKMVGGTHKGRVYGLGSRNDIAARSAQITKLTAALTYSEQRRVDEQESMSETVQQIKEQMMNLARRPTTSAPDDTNDERDDDDDYVEPTP
ncbi:hypothetical protein MTR67_040256 [Solanum verrucosum]|uniref:Uncharacterized protein n=1 Tax=Solanum verrucosum TaxID=315347 RepID=A0AAF0UK28_SOLVR|nr:hypothetical protein MTR67_040256 [Solanum verrucosum]